MRQPRRAPEGLSRRRAGYRSAWVGVLFAVAAAAGCGAVLAAAASTATPAGADPITDCSTTTGVVVVVDFSHFGGTVDRGCASTPTTGLDALHAAGFATAGTSEYGARFVCRIDTLPTPTQTPCTSTPPTSAYWANWYAVPGQTTWSYAQLGTMTYRPPPGSVTAWVFGSTTGGTGSARPSVTPTQVRATNPGPTGGGGGGGGSTPTTTAPATAPPTTAAGPAPTVSTATTAPGGGQSPSPGGRSGTGSTTPPGGTPTRGGGSGDTSTTSGGGSGTTTTTGADTGSGGTSTKGRDGPGGGGGSGRGRATRGSHPRIVDVQPASARLHPSSGSPLALAVGAAVAAVLAGAAVAVAWRRRRAGRTA